MRDSLEQRKPQLRKHSAIRDFHPTISYYAPEEVDQLLAELTQLRARVAILDAQEVELPDWEPNNEQAERWWSAIKDHQGGSVGAKMWYQCALSREHQLLDALRAIQAWREVARNYRGEHREWGCVTSGNQLCGACKAYDALAGKGE